MKLAAVVAVAALLLVPSAAATTSSGFSFSREGRNIIPFHARIGARGRVFVNQQPHGRLWVRGGCSARFQRLYNALAHAAGFA